MLSRAKMRYKQGIKNAVIQSETELNDKLYDHLYAVSLAEKFFMHKLKPTGILNGHMGDDNVRNEFTKCHKCAVVTARVRVSLS